MPPKPIAIAPKPILQHTEIKCVVGVIDKYGLTEDVTQKCGAGLFTNEANEKPEAAFSMYACAMKNFQEMAADLKACKIIERPQVLPKPVDRELSGELREDMKDKEIEFKKPTVTCVNGCAADSKCLPFGTRLLVDGKPSYCDITQMFEPQKGEKKECQNNYECSSNQCSNGNCVDLQKQLEETQSLLKKVMGWFKRFFGSSALDEGNEYISVQNEKE